MKKVLVVVAHPDDEVLGMGGTIVKLVAQGKEVHLLIVTDGSTTQYGDNDNIQKIIDEKKHETEIAAKIMGIHSILYGGLPDMKLDTIPHVDINKVIENAIDRFKPDTVFTHFWGDVNKDHQLVYESTLVATRPYVGQSVKEVYCFSVPSSTEWNLHLSRKCFVPSLFVEIEKYKGKKYRAMEAYLTELRKYPHPRSIKYLREIDTVVGLQVGLQATESFMPIRIIKC